VLHVLIHRVLSLGLSASRFLKLSLHLEAFFLLSAFFLFGFFVRQKNRVDSVFANERDSFEEDIKVHPDNFRVVDEADGFLVAIFLVVLSLLLDRLFNVYLLSTIKILLLESVFAC
jgi:hypothetical protein